MGLRRSVDAEGRGWMEWLSKFFFFFFFGMALAGYCGCEVFAIFGRREGRLLVEGETRPGGRG